MIYIALFINSVVSVLVLFLYTKYKKSRMERGMVIKTLILSNFVVFSTLYLLQMINPNKNFRDLFQPELHQEILGGSNRYISEIGESVFSSVPPF